MTDREQQPQPYSIAELRAAEIFQGEEVLYMPSADTFGDPDSDIEGPFGAFKSESSVPQPSPDERQQLLLDIIAKRPDDHIDRSTILDTQSIASRFLNLAGTCEYPDISTMVWARRAAFHMAGESFLKSGSIHRQFSDVFDDQMSSWHPAVKSWAETMETTDPDRFALVQAAAQLICRVDEELPYVQCILAATFMQIDYDRELAKAARVKPDDVHSELLRPAYTDPAQFRAVGLAATKYTEFDLEPWPAHELIENPDEPFDIEKGEIIRQENPLYQDAEPTDKGVRMLNALWLADVAKKDRTNSTQNTGDTAMMARRIDMNALEDHHAALHWVRHVVFDHRGIPFTGHARAATAWYNFDFPVSAEQWPQWLRDADTALDDDVELSNVLDEAIEFLYDDEGARYKRLYRYAAAVTLVQAKYYQQILEMRAEAEDDQSETTIARLRGDTGTEPLSEARVEPNIPIRRGGAMEHETLHPWDAHELLVDSSRPYDPKTNDMINPSDPDLIEPAEFSIEQQEILRLQQLRAAADAQAKARIGLIVSHSKNIAGKLTGGPVNDVLLGLSHRVRIATLDNQGVDIHGNHPVFIYQHDARINYSLTADKLIKVAEQARDMPFDNQDQADRFRAAIEICIDTPEQRDMAYTIAYLTRSHISNWREKDNK